MKVLALLFLSLLVLGVVAQCDAARAHPMASKLLSGLARGLYGDEDGKEMLANGRIPCIACTLVVGLIDGVAHVRSEKVEQIIAETCTLLPSLLQPWCTELMKVIGPTIVEELAKGEIPDHVCAKLNMCDNPQCTLFTPRKPKSLSEQQKLVESRGEAVAYEWEIPVANHRPLVDLDGDGHSTMFGLRGYAWRGRDCDDWNKGVHPGRVPVASGDSANVDYNCNGIKGTNPATGRSYEEELCGGTKPYGVAILGDSAAAHFAVPPSYITPALINSKTFKDLIKILESELDWPDMSSTTGYHLSNYTGMPGNQMSSLYLKNLARNKCSVRDFQNIAVNGARSGAMSNKIVHTMDRNPQTDNPMLVNLALIGNDVCNGRHNFDSMTKPQEMYDNTMRTLRVLDTKLPKGSHVLITGLADGRVLYEGLSDRIHPLGSARNDITYAQFYAYLNCMEASPCWGWMNNNATVRKLTAVRQRELNDVLARLATTETFQNFDVLYLDDPFKTIIDEWVRNGGHIHQLIESVDGFHPSQQANALMADYIWRWLETKAPHWLPPINPNNARITQIFGDQGGLN